MKKHKGFTLIELLVVVVLISILSGVILSVINVNGIRQKTRDAQRVADLKKIQTALELYFSDNRAYIVSSGWNYVSANLASLVTGGYISTLPTDPSPTGTSITPCSAAKNYFYKATVSSYILATRMEVASSAEESPCTSLNNWSTTLGCTMGTYTNCYGVENPF